jgi:hypothetical protein
MLLFPLALASAMEYLANLAQVQNLSHFCPAAAQFLLCQRTLLTGLYQGYEADHRDIELLRLRSFTLSRKLDDREVLGPHGLDRITELVGYLVPFVSSLSYLVLVDGGTFDRKRRLHVGTKPSFIADRIGPKGWRRFPCGKCVRSDHF